MSSSSSKQVSSTETVTSQDEAVDRMRSAYQTATDLLRSTHPKTQNSLSTIMTGTLQRGNSVRVEVASVSLFGRLAQWAERVVESRIFNCIMAILIFLNAIVIGIEAEISAQSAIENFKLQDQIGHSRTPRWLFFVDTGFNVTFVLELMLRIFALEGRFCAGRDWSWNAFDALVVSLSVVDMTLVARNITTSHIRVLRLTRAVRTLRMLRLLRYTSMVRKLRMMTLAIVNSRTMFLWAVIVLLLMMYLFSVIFLNVVSQYIDDAASEDTNVEELRVFFHSLQMTMLTLFMAVTGGVDWWEILELLLKISVLYAIVFLVFVVITILAILNVISAIFVNDAMECTHMDIDLRMQTEHDETKQMLERLTRIFQDMAPNSGGMVQLKDFVDYVERDEMKMLLSLIGLQFTDGVTLFKVLDVDGNMQLGIDEFVMGCLRLKGGSVQIDNHVLIRDIKHMLRETSRKQRHAVVTLTHDLRDLRKHVRALDDTFLLGPRHKVMDRETQ